MDTQTFDKFLTPVDTEKAWADILTWLTFKFEGFQEYQVEEKQFNALSTAYSHEKDCKDCTDISQCPHSTARLIPYQTTVNGYTVVRVAAETCRESKEVKESVSKTDRLEQSKIPRHRRRNTFKTFETTGMGIELMASKALAIECAENGRGLVIGGVIGCGKTHLALAVALDGIEKNKTALFYSLPELLETIRKDTLNGSTDLLDKCKCTDILVIDDVGTQRSKDFGDETIFKIIDHRYNNKLQTVVTTNAIGMEEFRDMLKGERAERTCSRLFEMTEQVWLDKAKDYRKIMREAGE